MMTTTTQEYGVREYGIGFGVHDSQDRIVQAAGMCSDKAAAIEKARLMNSAHQYAVDEVLRPLEALLGKVRGSAIDGSQTAKEQADARAVIERFRR